MPVCTTSVCVCGRQVCVQYNKDNRVYIAMNVIILTFLISASEAFWPTSSRSYSSVSAIDTWAHTGRYKATDARVQSPGYTQGVIKPLMPGYSHQGTHRAL